MASIEKYWYEPNLVSTVLQPLAWLFCLLVILRRLFYRAKILKSEKLQVPVIVIGNLSVGGTGKTPLVIAVIEHLKSQGFRPGIVSRGYGGNAPTWPQAVNPSSDPDQVGDEAVLLARRCRCPMSVGPDRALAARALLAEHACDVIISDDGLQHYALDRDVEVVVIDGARGFGNKRCLPAGPLREPIKRAKDADYVITNGVVTNGATAGDEIRMTLHMQAARNLKTPQSHRDLNEFGDTPVHAVAGIGNPQRFFNQLKSKGVGLIEHPFKDHHVYTAGDICFNDNLPVLMTEKDAVKCQAFAQDRHWYVPVNAEINNNFLQKLTEQLRKTDG